VLTAGVLLVALASCGGESVRATQRDAARNARSTSVPSSTAPPATAPADPNTPAPADPTSAPEPTPDASLPDRLVGVGGATQVVAVIADGYGSSTATVTAYQRSGAGWQTVFGPWAARIGRDGFAPPDAKREGDGRTPTGSFGFDFAFGLEPDPGVRLPYRVVTGPSIVWDDDPSSPHYNQWVDTTTTEAGADPEPMDNSPAYRYGVVIAYNEARTPGLGSAIFLHVSTGSSTAGCVALPTDELLAILRWLDPAHGPRIVMGTAATVAP
jgi:L,D-peptidoglycan transpeptidase YkuD (ErfK/YbiS/YcfS/YnhG family)